MAGRATITWHVALLLVGCMGSVVFLEIALHHNSQIGLTVTVTELIGGALFSGVGWLRALTSSTAAAGQAETAKTLALPLAVHAAHATLFTSMSYLGNYAFSFDVGVVTHTVVRSSSMIASVLVGAVFFGASHSLRDLVAAAIVSAGVALVVRQEANLPCATCAALEGRASLDALQASFAAAFDSVLGARGAADRETARTSSPYLVGVALLGACLMLQAFLAHLQSWSYGRYDPSPDGAGRKALATQLMASAHLFALLPVAGLAPQVVADVEQALAPEQRQSVLQLLREATGAFGDKGGWAAGLLEYLAHTVTGGGMAEPTSLVSQALASPVVPVVLLALLANNVMQATCISNVFALGALVRPLTMSLVMTLRKFLTVVLSVALYGKRWTLDHSAGGALVFGGLLVYTVLGHRDAKRKERHLHSQEKKKQ